MDRQTIEGDFAVGSRGVLPVIELRTLQMLRYAIEDRRECKNSLVPANITSIDQMNAQDWEDTLARAFSLVQMHDTTPNRRDDTILNLVAFAALWHELQVVERYANRLVTTQRLYGLATEQMKKYVVDLTNTRAQVAAWQDRTKVLEDRAAVLEDQNHVLRTTLKDLLDRARNYYFNSRRAKWCDKRSYQKKDAALDQLFNEVLALLSNPLAGDPGEV